jgi:AcrR family transcriptional regulator
VPRTRLTRSERAALTRSDLLEVAERRFLRDGYHATTVDAIAEDAGYTTGAVYSAFDGKAGLFLAVADVIIDRRLAEIAAVFADSADGESLLSTLAQRSVQESDGWFLVLIEFCVHAAREPGLRAEIAVRYGRARGGLAQFAADGTPLGPEGWALVTLALSNGLALERLIAPDSVPGDIMAAAQRLLYPPRSS